MKNIGLDFIPERIRLWAPPVLGIAAMLILSRLLDVARFLLFGHHLFWIIGLILLINPVSETFWPSPRKVKSKAKPLSPSFSRSRRRAKVRQHRAKQRSAPTSETPAERLARLQKEKEAVDEELESLTGNKSKVRNR